MNAPRLPMDPACRARRILSVVACALMSAAHGVFAQSKPAPPATTNTVAPPVREISPGVFQIGKIRLEKASRSIAFPAKVNMTNGPLEYLLVTPAGKTHESLLTTDTEPYHLHVAMLLLGAKVPQTRAANAPAGGPATAASLAKLRDKPMPGEPVTIELRWIAAGKEKTCRIEDLVLDTKAKKPMARGEFIFNGSLVWQGSYIAQQEGSILSAITDPGAIFNNTRPGRDDDDAWVVLTKETPPLDTPVTVTIKLTPPVPAKK